MHIHCIYFYYLRLRPRPSTMAGISWFCPKTNVYFICLYKTNERVQNVLNMFKINFIHSKYIVCVQFILYMAKSDFYLVNWHIWACTECVQNILYVIKVICMHSKCTYCTRSIHFCTSRSVRHKRAITMGKKWNMKFIYYLVENGRKWYLCKIITHF